MRTSYAGFRTTIKAVATGARGSRDLTFDEAREAMAALLAGEVSDAQAGAFLVAMRVKGEAAEELAGFAQALRDATEPARPALDRPIVLCAGAFDGVVDAPQLSIAAAAAAAGAGAAVVVACGGRIGPKAGVSPDAVLEALGGTARPDPQQSAAMLDRAGMAIAHAGTAVRGWERLVALRDEIGVRGPVHSAEKLVDFLGADRFVVGHAHGHYGELLLGALDRLDADRAVAVRGIEGSDVLRPARPTALGPGGRIELPERLGERLPPGDGAEGSAALTRAILDGDEDGTAAYAVALSAGVRLYAAGLSPDVPAGLQRAQQALADGRAAAALDAAVG